MRFTATPGGCDQIRGTDLTHDRTRSERRYQGHVPAHGWLVRHACPDLRGLQARLRHLQGQRTPKVHYILEEQKMDVTQIYSQVRKRRGRAKILANAQVEFKDGLEAKFVFVRNKRIRDWLALIATDLTLADEDVVRIYGKRLGYRSVLPNGQAALGIGEMLPGPGLRRSHCSHDHRDDPIHIPVKLLDGLTRMH